MNRSTIILLSVLGGFVLILLWGVGAYNRLVGLSESTESQWANVQSAYQRRADLIPNLVSTVKGYADFEKSTLTDVIEARSKATSVQIRLTILLQIKLRNSKKLKVNSKEPLAVCLFQSSATPT